MVTHPIQVKRDDYRGADKRKRIKTAENNAAAVAIEQSINAMLLEQTKPIKSYGYDEISNRTGYSIETVRRLCFSIDCSHNGFTAIRNGLTYDQAMLEHSS